MTHQDHFLLKVQMGKGGLNIGLQVLANNTIDDIKAKIMKQQYIQPDTYTLVWKGKPLLEGFRPLAEYHVDTDELKIMHMVI